CMLHREYIDFCYIGCFFFFFQAEDGIRDYKVTGVQTCALPISALRVAAQQANSVKAVVSRGGRPDLATEFLGKVKAPTLLIVGGHDRQVLKLNEMALKRRSEERRVGKECRSGWAWYDEREKG